MAECIECGQPAVVMPDSEKIRRQVDWQGNEWIEVVSAPGGVTESAWCPQCMPSWLIGAVEDVKPVTPPKPHISAQQAAQRARTQAGQQALADMGVQPQQADEVFGSYADSLEEQGEMMRQALHDSAEVARQIQQHSADRGAISEEGAA